MSCLTRMTPLLVILLTLVVPATGRTATAEDEEARGFGERIEDSPFVELYVLDELKALRTEMAKQKNELIQQVVDREIGAVDRAITYATDTVTYFFYLIAAASSMLVLVGWTSVRDIKERVHNIADAEINKLVEEYEGRLYKVESLLKQKTDLIDENREEIQLTQDIHSLWLRAAQDTGLQPKIAIYDQILTLNPKDTEALTYKADTVLELNEPQWAVNLCQQALAIDPENAHAFYQLACAHTALQQFDEAIRCLAEALQRSDAYREEIADDPHLAPLVHTPALSELLNVETKAAANA